MFSVKLKVKEAPRNNSLPRRRRATPGSSFSSSTSSLSRLQSNGNKVPAKSSFLSNKNGKNNKKVRIQTSYERLPTTAHGRWTKELTLCNWLSFSLLFGPLTFHPRNVHKTRFDTHSCRNKKWAFWRWLDSRVERNVYGVCASRTLVVGRARSPWWCHRLVEFLARASNKKKQRRSRRRKSKRRLMIKSVNIVVESFLHTAGWDLRWTWRFRMERLFV